MKKGEWRRSPKRDQWYRKMGMRAIDQDHEMALLEQKTVKKKYIYFIRERLGELAPVKIGKSDNPWFRMKELQCGNSRHLVIAALMGPFSPRQATHLEKQMHDKFKRHHLRGEWFSGVVLWQLGDISEEVDEIDLPVEEMYSD